MLRLTSHQDPYAAASKTVLIQTLQAAVRDSQDTKRASYNAEHKPEWWRPGFSVSFYTGETATIMEFGSHRNQSWKIQDARALLCFYDAWKRGDRLWEYGNQPDEIANETTTSPLQTSFQSKAEHVSPPAEPAIGPPVQNKKKRDTVSKSRSSPDQLAQQALTPLPLDYENTPESEVPNSGTSVKEQGSGVSEHSSSEYSSEEDVQSEKVVKRVVTRTRRKISDHFVDQSPSGYSATNRKQKTTVRALKEPPLKRKTSGENAVDNESQPETSGDAVTPPQPVPDVPSNKRRNARSTKATGRTTRVQRKARQVRKQSDALPESPKPAVDEEIVSRRSKRNRKISNSSPQENHPIDEQLEPQRSKAKISDAMMDEECDKSEDEDMESKDFSPESEVRRPTQCKQDVHLSSPRMEELLEEAHYPANSRGPKDPSGDHDHSDGEQESEVIKRKSHKTRKGLKSQKRKSVEGERIPLREMQNLTTKGVRKMKRQKGNAAKPPTGLKKTNTGHLYMSGSENEDGCGEENEVRSSRDESSCKRSMLLSEKISDVRKLVAKQLRELDDAREHKAYLIKVQVNTAVVNMKMKYRAFISKYPSDVLNMPIKDFVEMHGGNLDSVLMRGVEGDVMRSMAELREEEDGEGREDEVGEGEFQSPSSPAAFRERREAVQLTVRKTLRKVRAEEGRTERRTVRRSVRHASKLSKIRTRDMISKGTPNIDRTFEMAFAGNNIVDLQASVRKYCEPNPAIGIARLREALDRYEKENL